jgi:hypothetical protein
MMGNETASLKKESLQKALLFLEKKKRERSSTADLYEKEREGTRALLALLSSLLLWGADGRPI